MIQLILKNPVYIGYKKWDNHIKKSNHQPIISFNIFRKIQRKIIKKKGKIEPSIKSLINKYVDVSVDISRKIEMQLKPGPWGSLASFYLGVVVTRVQISAGPLPIMVKNLH